MELAQDELSRAALLLSIAIKTAVQDVYCLTQWTTLQQVPQLVETRAALLFRLVLTKALNQSIQRNSSWVQLEVY